MVLLVYKGLEVFPYFPILFWRSFGGGSSFNEMCNIMIVSRIILPT